MVATACAHCGSEANSWEHQTSAQCAGLVPNGCQEPSVHHDYVQQRCATHKRLRLDETQPGRDVWVCSDCGQNVSIETIVYMVHEKAGACADCGATFYQHTSNRCEPCDGMV